ncbi:hypothetical protein V8F20_010981 [Naviculisporaceae sp. PSN 640]
MNTDPLNVNLEWAFATQRWLPWVSPDPEVKTDCGLEDWDEVPVRRALDRSKKVSIEQSSGDGTPASTKTAATLSAPAVPRAIPAPGLGQTSSSVPHPQAMSRCPAHRPGPKPSSTDPTPTSAPTLAPRATSPCPGPRLGPRSSSEPIGPTPRDDRFNISAASSENKMHMKNGRPPLISRRFWPVRNPDSFDWILESAHPELTPVMRLGVIKRIQSFRMHIWDGKAGLHSALKQFVYGSGNIDRWGYFSEESEEIVDGFNIVGGLQSSGLTKTGKICDKGEYFQTAHSRKSCDNAQNSDMRKRQVANHAKAVKHAIEKMIVGEPTWSGANPQWSTELFKKIHSILMEGFCRRAGEYRTEDDEVTTNEAGAKAETETEAEDDISVISSPSSSGFSDIGIDSDDRKIDRKRAYSIKWKEQNGKLCLKATALNEYMGRMIEELNRDARRIQIHKLSSSTGTGSSRERSRLKPPQVGGQKAQQHPPDLDPYTLAAKYAQYFLMISPFTNGNGLISRIIICVLLLKYEGKIAPIGCRLQEGREYRDIVSRAAKKSRTEIMKGIELAGQSSHIQMANYLRRITCQDLQLDSSSDSEWVYDL